MTSRSSSSPIRDDEQWCDWTSWANSGNWASCGWKSARMVTTTTVGPCGTVAA